MRLYTQEVTCCYECPNCCEYKENDELLDYKCKVTDESIERLDLLPYWCPLPKVNEKCSRK